MAFLRRCEASAVALAPSADGADAALLQPRGAPPPAPVSPRLVEARALLEAQQRSSSRSVPLSPRGTRQTERLAALRAQDKREQEEGGGSGSLRHFSPAKAKLRNSKMDAAPVMTSDEGGEGEGDVMPATRDVCASFFGKLVACLETFPDPAQRSAGKLWFQYDNDGSGFMDWGEFRMMCRNRYTQRPPGLQANKTELPDVQLKALWARADHDRGGQINLQEFMAFLRFCEAAATDPVGNYEE